MTLITKYIKGEDYIILAADKRLTHYGENGEEPEINESATKLYVGGNYVIGLQGAAKTLTNDYQSRISSFVKEHPNLPPKELKKCLSELLKDSAVDEFVKELNLTVAGTSNGKLFSFHYRAKNNLVEDCTNDEFGLRFNAEGSSDHPQYRAYKIFFDRFFRNQGLATGFSIEDYSGFSKEQILASLEFTYKTVGDNDYRHKAIGPTMDYCVITLDGIEELYLT